MSQAIKDIKLTLPEEEIMTPGHLACQGCGAALAMRYALKALGRKTMISLPACCWSVIDGPFPYSTTNVPLVHVVFEAAAAFASGIRSGLNRKGQNDVNVLAWGGDGSTFDIGLQAWSGAAERNDDIIYFVYDNEAYMNTGIQRSGATPYGAWTTTTPGSHFKSEPKKDIMGIVAAHRVPYAATLSLAHPEDFVRKVKKAATIRGFKFLHILAPCPPGWKMRPDDAIKSSRLAVQTRIFPVYEVEGGIRYTLNINVPNPKPVMDYLKLQGRFRHLKEDETLVIQKNVDSEWELLMERIELGKKHSQEKANRKDK